MTCAKSRSRINMSMILFYSEEHLTRCTNVLLLFFSKMSPKPYCTDFHNFILRVA